MRKAFTIIIVLFIVIASGIILLVEDEKSQVSVLSLKKHYSRLITGNQETISIPLYFSSNKSFLTEINSIEDTYLLDDFNQLKISVNNIRYVSDCLDDFNNTYYLYMFDINFEEVTIDKIDFSDTLLKIIYKNQDFLELSIGEMNLVFKDVYQDPNLDIFRVYTTVKTIDNTEYISGLVLGLDNFNKEITIQNISIGTEEIELDTSHLYHLDHAITYDIDIDTVLETNYNPLNIGIQLDFRVEAGLILIPFTYKNDLFLLNRFPIYIEYLYQNATYKYILDDFMYISESFNLEVANGNIQEYIYYY
ncbi:hypothetical protein ACAG96_01405 [Candidatus Izemoplasma sp. B36]|uniref:hypothetical protein n=1 Tax=Candidatus Izemoplasma sp. B36 TaxID=3242468 RepID=UPI003558EC9C